MRTPRARVKTGVGRALRAGVIASLCLIDAGAHAEGFWAHDGSYAVQQHGNLFIGVGTSAAWQLLPRWNAGEVRASSIAFTTQRYVNFEPDHISVSPTVAFGYVLPKGSYPKWMGRNLRLTLSVSGLFGGDETSTTDLNGGARSITAVDGRVGVAPTAVPAGSVFTDSFDFNRSGVEVALRATSDFSLFRNFSVHPSIGVFGAWNRESYSYHGLRTGGVLSVYNVDQTMNTGRFGADIGIGARWQVSKTVWFQGNLRMGLQYALSRLRSNDCFDGVTGTGACAAPSGSFTAGTLFNTTSTDSASDFGYRLTRRTASTGTGARRSFRWACSSSGKTRSLASSIRRTSARRRPARTSASREFCSTMRKPLAGS